MSKRQADVRLAPLSTNASRQLNVLGHNGDALAVNGAEVGVLKQRYEIGLSSLLEGENSRGLEAQIVLEVLCNLTNQTLKGQLADKELSGLLILADLTKGDGSGTIAMRLLNASGGGRRLARRLRGERLARSFASRRLTGGLQQHRMSGARGRHAA